MLGFKNFLLDEDGAGVVEMILIIVVLIGLVLIFKKQLTTLVNNIFQTISREAGKVGEGVKRYLPQCFSCWCHSFCLLYWKPAGI